jgi:hypothetical protein
MRNGVFTEVIYTSQVPTPREVTRKGLIIGPPMRTEVKKQLLHWDTLATELKVNVPAGSDGYDISQLLKPKSGDKVTADADIKFYLSKSDGTDEIEMVGAETEDDLNKLVAGLDAISHGDYNAATASQVLATLSQDHALKMKLAGGDDAIDLEEIDAENKIWKITDFAGDTTLETGISNVSKGDTLRCIAGSEPAVSYYAKVISVNTSDNSLMVKAITTGFNAVGTKSADYDIFYDYHGATIGLSRKPVIKFSITANRTDYVGKYSISDPNTLIEMFGENSIANPDSILAYDAFKFYVASLTSFNIYCLELDDDTSGRAVTNTAADHVTAQAKMSAAEGYFIVPCYRLDAAADTDNIKAILSLYKTWVETRSSVNNKKECRLWCAYPIINMGYGYTDADGADPAGLDLSGEVGTLYVNCGTDPQEDVDAAVGVPATFASDRVTLLPYYAYYGTQLIEGSTIAAILAGERAALSEGKNLGYSRTYSVVNNIASLPSVEYFNEDQLEALKDAGWQMIEQAMYGDPVTIRHQMTTDTSGDIVREEHFRILLDSLAQTCRATLRKMIANGYDNVISQDADAVKTKRYLAKLNMALNGIRMVYTQRHELISELTVLSYYQNETYRDQVDYKLGVSLYFPVNRLNLYIYV